jgi:hypothetical protein
MMIVQTFWNFLHQSLTTGQMDWRTTGQLNRLDKFLHYIVKEMNSERKNLLKYLSKIMLKNAFSTLQRENQEDNKIPNIIPKTKII